MENDISMLLTNNNIEFIEQKKFSWLGLQSLDFYLPKYNIGIECQGIQHFKPRDFAYKGDEWAKELYKKILDRDKRKNNLCTKNGVKILYVTDCDMEVVENSENKPLYENIIRDVNVLKNILQ